MGWGQVNDAPNLLIDPDGDGHSASDDALPLDSSEWFDTDLDGIGNNADTDDDNDSVLDTDDLLPLDASESADTDSDGVGDNADNCLDVKNTDQLDTDNDSLGNACDEDDDNDGVIDELDALPLDTSEQIDTDADGIGNNADLDDDNDGVPDTLDTFSLDPNEQLDTDFDGVGNNSDTDDDNDGVDDDNDAYPLNNLYSADSDGDGMPDAWEVLYDLNPQDRSDANSDTDNDGAVALQEFFEGTIPTVSDLDSGGTTDGGTTGGGTTDGGATDGGATDGGGTGTPGVEMIGGFGGAVFDEAASSYTFPAGSEVWAGFANLNEGIYPFTFANGGSITFTAAVAAGGSDTNVYFRFERLPFPDVDPSFDLNTVTISGEAELEYTVTIPAQAAANTYESFLLYVVDQDSTVIIKNIVVTDDSGSTGGDRVAGGGSNDGGITDGGTTDGGTTDGGTTDGGPIDCGGEMGPADGGTTDGGTTHGGSETTTGVEMIGGFGGAVYDEAASSYTFPAGSEVWAGFANLNVDIYPFTFANGGSITFTAAVAAGGSDTNVYFRFERLPFPDVDPSFDLNTVTISGEAELEYSITIPAQDAGNTYSSFYMYVVDQDSLVMIKDIVVNDDGGSSDGASGSIDGGTTDGDPIGCGTTDGGLTDTPIPGVEMIEGFGGAVFDEAASSYTLYSGSEDWAGFANLNEGIYPFTFANGGSINFTAAVAAGGSTDVYFRFERLPFPDVDPSFDLDTVTISGRAELEYTVTIPAQDAANTYESFLMYVVEQNSTVIIKNIVVNDDGGSSDDASGATDGGDITMGVLDVDGNGFVDALTDTLLITRYVFGFTGNDLIKGAVGEDATRTSSEDIEAYLDSLMSNE